MRTKKLVAAGLAGAVGLGALAATPAVAQTAADAVPGLVEGSPLDQWLDRLRERRAANQEAMAAELGIDVDTLEQARRAAAATVADEFPVDDDGFTEEELVARGDRFEQELAAELGVGVDELRTAARVVLIDRLDEAVARGRIDQDRADALLAAFDAGTLGVELRRDAVEAVEPRLAEAVASGRLTQDEADQVLTALGNGTLRSLLRERAGG